MAGPKYLTGDKSGIEEFIDKFDVCTATLHDDRFEADERRRSFCLTAMVSRTPRDAKPISVD